MKSFNQICAQGDVLIRRASSIPKTANKIVPENNHVIVTHSETGHHHVMEAERVELFQDNDNPLIAWIKVNRPATLTHLREHDTHEPIAFEPGVYEVRRQREYVAEGFRKAQD